MGIDNKNMPRLSDVVQFASASRGATRRDLTLEFSPSYHTSARLVVRGPMLSKWLHKDGSSAQHGLGFESSNYVYSIS